MKWREAVASMESGYAEWVFNNVNKQRDSEKVYPEPKQVFRAFTLPFEEVKVVIVGQDPYYTGQANGLAFSVPSDVSPPPSLRNIFKEIGNDVYDGTYPDPDPDLERWHTQGVLLLNAFLTVRHRQPASHRDVGWEYFTNDVIVSLSLERDALVFMLWGNYAKKKDWLIDENKHLILKAAHPSPLAAHRGFFGCRHFSRANEWLAERGKEPIQW